MTRHPGILEAAVIGTNLPNSTNEAPRAYIVKVPGRNIDGIEIKQHMSLYLAKYKALDGGIAFTDSIPRTPAGKVAKKILRERVEKERKEIVVKKLILSALSMYGKTRISVSGDLGSVNISQSARAK